MTYKVLIVDDSNFFQTRLKEIVNQHPQLNVVGVAANGQEAVELAAKLKPDVISMDYEMPLLDGVSAVKKIMADDPVPIIMFSSMTYEGAKITLDALSAGAVDFMNKNFAEVSNNSASFNKKLHDKLVTFAKGAAVAESNPPPQSEASPVAKEPIKSQQQNPVVRRRESPEISESPARTRDAFRSAASRKGELKGKVKLLAIGASTGGPVAVSEMISQFPRNFPVPIIVIQHMPENFTKAFAERMNRNANLHVKEAETGDRVEAGHVLVAPGGKQLIFDKNGSSIKIIEGDDRVNYRPCVDITFASAANTFGGHVLGVVLTGMGSDGCEGARLLKQRGATIWSQDQQSSVVYGMPAAVARENLTDRVLTMRDFAPQIIDVL